MTDALSIRIALKRDAFDIEVSAELPAHGITVLFGPSGCGKSSVLRCIAGLEPDCKGYIALNGEVWQDDKESIFVKPYERPAALAFQHGALFPHMTVRKNLEFGLQRKGKLSRVLGADDIISLLDLGDLLQRRPGELSGGEIQRVSIGRTLLTHPRLLLLDEPMSGLDYRRKEEFLPFLERLHEELEIPVLYVSHMPGEVMRLADHLVLMHAGKIKLVGPLDQVLFDDAVPSALQNSVQSFVPGEISAYDGHTRSVIIDTVFGQLTVPSQPRTPRQQVRLAIPANAVQISQADGAYTATVGVMSHEAKGKVLVRYVVDGQALIGCSPIADLPQYPLPVNSQLTFSINSAMVEIS